MLIFFSFHALDRNCVCVFLVYGEFYSGPHLGHAWRETGCCRRGLAEPLPDGNGESPADECIVRGVELQESSGGRGGGCGESLEGRPFFRDVGALFGGVKLQESPGGRGRRCGESSIG